MADRAKRGINPKQLLKEAATVGSSTVADLSKLRRKDNPASKIARNLPKKKQGEVVLSLQEARVVWETAQATGYPFGTHVQLMLLTACRLDEWASARWKWIDMSQAVMVIPAGEYKTDHVHVVPLVPQAIEILKMIPKPQDGDYPAFKRLLTKTLLLIFRQH
jgi:integrase